MIKTLVLLRHGEALSPQTSQSDKDRKLSDEGKQQLTRLNDLLKVRDFFFDLVIYSPAVRTEETAAIIVQNITVHRLYAEPTVYESSLDNLINLINNLPKEANNVLLVGHNPALTGLIGYFTGDFPLIMNPGMMCILSFEHSEWSHVGKEDGNLLEVLQ